MARLPFLIPGMLSLLAAIWLGLARLNFQVPLWADSVTGIHGPLMVSGFLGTLIGLERAVAMGRPWAYGAPLLTGIGAALLAAAPRAPAGPIAMTAGAAVLTGVSIAVYRKQPSLHLAVMALGALLLAAGDLLWLTGLPIYRIVLWWVGFPVFTIAGERLELNRVLRPSRWGRIVFRCVVVLLPAGLLLSLVRWDDGVRTAGAAWVILGLWLAHFDVARRTIRAQGLTRFIAACLLGGYAWLVFAGILALTFGGVIPGPRYDALLHSLFLGFTFAMILGHAPVIFPAVLGWAVPYHPTFYAPLVLLHLSLAVRVGSDLAWWIPGREWAGLANALALVMFLAGNLAAVVRGRRFSLHPGRKCG